MAFTQLLDNFWQRHQSGLVIPEINDVQHASTQLLELLGYESSLDQAQFFKCSGSDKADVAAREKKQGLQPFAISQKDPFIVVENKPSNWKFKLESPQYWNVRDQLQRYLLSQRCKTARFGLIYNGLHLQLLYHQDNLVYPLTGIIQLDPGKLDATIAYIKNLIQTHKRGTIIACYANKGGVGKTTTTLNLGLELANRDKHVLLIDFDHSQGGLTQILQAVSPQLVPFKGQLLTTLENTALPNGVNAQDGRKLIFHWQTKNYKIDVLAYDCLLKDMMDADYLQRVQLEALEKLSKDFAAHYDFVLIDTPPNWKVFAKQGLMAADLVLSLAQHDNYESITNTRSLVENFLPEIRSKKQDLAADICSDIVTQNTIPELLPLYFNRWESTLMQEKRCKVLLDNVSIQCLHENRVEYERFLCKKDGFGYPEIHKIHYRNEISRAPMEGDRAAPAVVKYVKARESYRELVNSLIG